VFREVLIGYLMVLTDPSEMDPDQFSLLEDQLEVPEAAL